VPEFPLVLARRLSRRLSRATSDLARAADTEKAYQRFVTQQGGGNIMELVGRSEYARKLQAAIGDVAPGTAPVLAQGPAGTEMEAVAWAVHRAGGKVGDSHLQPCKTLMVSVLADDRAVIRQRLDRISRQSRLLDPNRRPVISELAGDDDRRGSAILVTILVLILIGRERQG
jgi:hypothetical protein